MGASLSSTEPNKLAIAAVSHVMHLDRDSVLHFHEACVKRVQNSEFALTNEQFNECCLEIKLHPSDKEILNKLFILNDPTGDGVVNYRDFLFGLAAISKGNSKEKLNLALTLCDSEKKGVIVKDQLKHVLECMSSTSSFFGDRPPTAESLQNLVDGLYHEVRVDTSGDLTYDHYLSYILESELLEEFVSQSKQSVKLQRVTADD